MKMIASAQAEDPKCPMYSQVDDLALAQFKVEFLKTYVTRDIVAKAILDDDFYANIAHQLRSNPDHRGRLALYYLVSFWSYHQDSNTLSSVSSLSDLSVEADDLNPSMETSEESKKKN